MVSKNNKKEGEEQFLFIIYYFFLVSGKIAILICVLLEFVFVFVCFSGVEFRFLLLPPMLRLLLFPSPICTSGAVGACGIVGVGVGIVVGFWSSVHPYSSLGSLGCVVVVVSLEDGPGSELSLWTPSTVIPKPTFPFGPDCDRS